MNTRVSDIDPMTSSRVKALASIADGNYRRALRRYRKHLAVYPHDNLARAEMLSVEILSGRTKNARAMIDAIPDKDARPEIAARILTAEGYLKVMSGNEEGGREDLCKVRDLDSDFGLPFLSLGRYELFACADTAKARKLLARAGELIPGSIGPWLPLVQIELQEKNYLTARKVAGRIARRFPLHPKAGLAYLWAALMAAPMRGIPILLMISVGVCLPHAGLVILCLWMLLALLSFILLRKTIPLLAFLPAAELPGLLGLLLIRWLFWGRIYP
jgi:tetratricopeptide (TPR) repeat protein